jgi:TonB family protein
LENLPPGRYLIAAGLIDFPSYFPGVASSATATAIVVNAAATTPNIDFAMVTASALSISGRVVSMPDFLLNVPRMVRLIGTTATTSSTTEQVEIKPDGAFRFSRVRPGSYTVSVLPLPVPYSSRAVSVTVRDNDVEGVELKVNVTVTVTAAAVVDANGADGLIPRFTLTLTPFRGGESAAQIPIQRADTRSQVVAGDYRVSWNTLPAGYFLKSITTGSTDLLASPLKVVPQGAPPRIVATLGVTSPPPWVKVSGRVTGISNNPTSAPLRASLTEVTTTTAVPDVPVNVDGSFEFPMVLPGLYTVRLTPMPPMSPVSVTVSSRDLTGLQIAIPPLKPLTVRFSVSGNGPSPSALTMSIIDSISGAMAIPGTAQPDGTFKVMAPEGAYRIALTVPGFTVQELKYGADDVARQPINVSVADRAELLATVTPSPGAGGSRVLGGVLGGTLGGVIGALTPPTGVAPPTPGAPPPPPPPPPPPSGTDPIRVGGDVLAANCISCPAPAYPDPARTIRISDTVVLSVIVGKDGTVREVRVIRGHQLLQQAAVDTVKQWRYRPQMLNGQPVEVTASVSISFVFK